MNSYSNFFINKAFDEILNQDLFDQFIFKSQQSKKKIYRNYLNQVSKYFRVCKINYKTMHKQFPKQIQEHPSNINKNDKKITKKPIKSTSFLMNIEAKKQNKNRIFLFHKKQLQQHQKSRQQYLKFNLSNIEGLVQQTKEFLKLNTTQKFSRNNSFRSKSNNRYFLTSACQKFNNLSTQKNNFFDNPELNIFSQNKTFMKGQYLANLAIKKLGNSKNITTYTQSDIRVITSTKQPKIEDQNKQKHRNNFRRIQYSTRKDRKVNIRPTTSFLRKNEQKQMRQSFTLLQPW